MEYLIVVFGIFMIGFLYPRKTVKSRGPSFCDCNGMPLKFGKLVFGRKGNNVLLEIDLDSKGNIQTHDLGRYANPPKEATFMAVLHKDLSVLYVNEF